MATLEKPKKKSTKNKQSNKPINIPEKTINNPGTTIEKPETTIDEAETTIDKSETTIDKPKITIDEPKTTVDQPEKTINCPSTTIDKAETTIEPKTTIDQPETTINKQEIPTENPEKIPDQQNGVSSDKTRNLETATNLQKLIETINIVTYPELPDSEPSQINPEEATKNLETTKNAQTVKIEETIKPFTEPQLTALYTNQEIPASKQFIRQFIETELRGVAAKKHPLYDLITSYLRAREKLQQITIEVNQLRNDLNESQNQLWVINDAKITGKAQCLDNATVSATHTFKTAKFQRNTLESLVLLQNKIKRLTNYVYTLYSYNCCLFKLKIEFYLDSVYARCEKHLNLSNNVTLLEENADNVNGALQELRLCISVLFYFQRQLHKDKDVLLETRNWLTNMISLLLRNSNWQDHMYLLNHVLRCPAGINTWAARYIQAPSPLFFGGNDAPFANRYVNHIIAVLSVILMPIDKRDAFLEQITSTLNEPTDLVAENVWVLVDSDGESDDDTTCGILSLKENDLVSLLNQIPLDYLFRAVLLIEHKDNRDSLDAGKLTEHHVLRLFAFSTVLVRLINNGLETYQTARYNQFAKRLCRLMRHILQYASDAWEIYKNTNVLSDRAMLHRLQVEFDAFFLRTTRHLFNAQTLGSWQFLAVAPFHMVSVNCLWHFFYLLHQDATCGEGDEPTQHFDDYKRKLSETSQKQQFHDRLCVMSVEQAYYLLNTFGNMIMARPSTDWDFIQFATLNLLQIGFTETENQESSRKCAAILLSNITQKYPNLISDILTYIRLNINNLESLVFLFSELPLFLWKPSINDINILTIWLLQHPVNSVENFLARKIFLNLNYSNVGNEMFLPLDLHRQIAILIVEAVEKHVTEPESTFTKFAWCVVYQLRLHATDRDTSSVDGVPDAIRFDVLQRGIRQKMALALYCAVAMTTVGHLLPLVCADALAHLVQLAQLYKHDAVLVSLYYVVPLFLDNIDALLMCTSYQSVVSSLLNADKTYYKMAKSLIAAEFPGAVLEQFRTVIRMHLHNPKWHPLFVFWAKTLVAVPQWHSNKSVLFLLDCVASVAFFVPEMYQQVEAVFNELLVEEVNERNNGSNSSLLSWVPLVGNSQSIGSSVLLQGTACSDETWFMYLVISLEHQQIEVKTGLWPQLLKQLHENKGKTNIDASLKKAANIVKIPSYTSNGLCIYRWCQLALDTALDHPLLPLIWQKFFSLYLIRVPGLDNSGSVGSKFFDGVINTNFLKRIKRRLQESVEYYKQKVDEAKTNKAFAEKCLNIFKAFVLWLEEPIIMEANLYFPSLPPQYEPTYLAHIIQNTTSPWMEFINYEEMRKKYEDDLNNWLKYCNRSNKFRPPLQKIGAGDLKNPTERLLRRLGSYDKPLPVPKFNRSAVIIPTIDITNPETIGEHLHPYIKKLQQYAEIFALQVSEHIALDSQYKELVPQLYQNFSSKINMKRTCKATCTGVANIRLSFSESRINESIKHQLETNRNNFASLSMRSMQAPSMSMCMNCASFEQTVDTLIAHYTTDGVSCIGTELFYYLLNVLNNEMAEFPPTQQMFHNCLEKLGGVFVRGVEGETLRLLRKIIQSPAQNSLLIPHFIVGDFGSSVFLQLYQEISQQLEVMPEITLSLITKFDINSWLCKKAQTPRLVDRSKFIQILFESLCKLSGRKHAALQEVYRRHLLTIFQFEFPNHYGEVLMKMLQCSAQQTLIVEVWLDVMNVLTHPLVVAGAGDNVRDLMRRHATHQQLLRLAELKDTCGMLARFFSQERLQFGLYGLYPKYRAYIDQLPVFLGLTFHAYTVATLNAASGELADNLVALHLWPTITEFFAPWLVPYSVKDTSATWIQQLTDDRAVLLPWIQADISHAQLMFNMFINCVLFIADTLPASGCLLCFVWQFYATHFAHAPVKQHILVVVHISLAKVPWDKFWPSLTDLEIMLKVLDQYLPECHSFLGKLFLEVNWSCWLTHLMHQTGEVQVVQRVHHCLLHLLVKLSNEPTVRQNDKARGLVEKCREFGSWFLLDVQSLDSALDWYIMSCDPRVVLLDNTEMIKQIDNATYQLLRIVSYYNINITEIQENAQILEKRQCFIRAFIKILINCSSRYKNLITTNPQQFSATLNAQLDYLEAILNNVPNEAKAHNSDVLLREFMGVVNNPSLSQISINCVNQWLANRTGNNIILCSIVRNLQIISDDDAMSCILEQALNSYFSEQLEGEDVQWTGVLQLLDNLPPRQKFETVLINNGRLLTLYSILLRKLRFSLTDDAKSCETLLEMIINWLMNIKGTDLIEDKLPLFWVQVIRLSLKLCHFGSEEKCAIVLRKFVHQHLMLVAENKSAPSESNAVSWGRGLLGAIGLIKQNAVSLQCRFLCKSMAAYILAQLPDTRNKTASVRCFSGAASPVGQPGGNPDCARILLRLEPSGSTPELKSIVETSLKQIQDPQNSMHNAEHFLFSLINKLYTNKIYLQRL